MSMPTTETKTDPVQIHEPNALVGTIAGKLLATLSDAEGAPTAASVLEWIAAQRDDVIKQAIVNTQPKGWAVAAGPLVESLTPDQRAGVLAALMAVFVQRL